MKIAIMQPTYLPWMGYFAMIDRVERFIILDSVQFAKRSWQQRNKIKTANGPIWLTVPVKSKGRRDQRIRDVLIEQERDFSKNHINAIEHNYRKADFFNTYSSELFDILGKKHLKLEGLTTELICWLKDKLCISTPIIFSNGLKHTGTKAELLAGFCEELGADEYVAPLGSRDYIQASNCFSEKGITVTYHEYEHPRYRQQYGDFMPYISVIDLLFNEGPDSLSIIRKGVRN